jgi:hypothetical protein
VRASLGCEAWVVVARQLKRNAFWTFATLLSLAPVAVVKVNQAQEVTALAVVAPVVTVAT